VVNRQPAAVDDVNDNGYYVGTYGTSQSFTAFMASPDGNVTILKYPGGYIRSWYCSRHHIHCSCGGDKASRKWLFVSFRQACTTRPERRSNRTGSWRGRGCRRRSGPEGARSGVICSNAVSPNPWPFRANVGPGSCIEDRPHRMPLPNRVPPAAQSSNSRPDTRVTMR
jgi:hypothetical protein